MAQARPSMQELIGRRRRAGFVGRSDERAAFRENLDLPPEDERHRFLFHVHGNAGVGKTFLVRELEQIARARGALTGYVDEGAGSVPEAMAVLCRQLDRQGHRLKKLEEALVAHRERRHEAEAEAAALEPAPDGSAPDGPSPLTTTAVRLGMAGVGALVPGAGCLRRSGRRGPTGRRRGPLEGTAQRPLPQPGGRPAGPLSRTDPDPEAPGRTDGRDGVGPLAGPVLRHLRTHGPLPRRLAARADDHRPVRRPARERPRRHRRPAPLRHRPLGRFRRLHDRPAARPVHGGGVARAARGPGRRGRTGGGGGAPAHRRPAGPRLHPRRGPPRGPGRRGRPERDGRRTVPEVGTGPGTALGGPGLRTAPQPGRRCVPGGGGGGVRRGRGRRAVRLAAEHAVRQRAGRAGAVPRCRTGTDAAAAAQALATRMDGTAPAARGHVPGVASGTAGGPHRPLGGRGMAGTAAGGGLPPAVRGGAERAGCSRSTGWYGPAAGATRRPAAGPGCWPRPERTPRPRTRRAGAGTC
ncbi:ATP-binding protein [Streptomyces lasalocidi]